MTKVIMKINPTSKVIVKCGKEVETVYGRTAVC